jgi:TRAP-type uncharacterized transport system substrate-binding protein
MSADPKSPTDRSPKAAAARLRLKIMTVSWWDLAQTLGPILLLGAIAILLAVHYVRPAPPHTLTLTSGPKGSRFATVAEQYRKILARNGITLRIVESEGSMDNLRRISDPHSGVDIALVQSGLASGDESDDLTSLGSMFYQPLLIFYRTQKPLLRLSEMQSHSIAIGPEGSGTRSLALALLKANGIEPGGSTPLLPLEGEQARAALLHRQVEAIFLTGDSASSATIREMLHTEGVRLFDFSRADAYVRRFAYLHKIVVPTGAFDLGEDLPPTDVNLLAPTVELIARSNLHPALCDLLIDAAYSVHSRGSVMQSAGEFPNAAAASFPLSEEAARYYKSGSRSFTYRYLPFWLASLVNRALVVLVPILVVVIPGLRFLPQLYRWRIDSRIYRRYGELMAVERESLGRLTPERRTALIERLEDIERSVIRRKMPGSRAEQTYVLRQHISFVRANLARGASDADRTA